MLPPNASTPQMPSNPSNPPKRAKPALGAAKLRQVYPFLVPNCCCQTSGFGKPSLSVSTGPKLPHAPCHSGSWSCQTRGCGKPSGSFLVNSGEKLAAVASQVVLFLMARNCRMLLPNPSNPSNPSKRAKPALGAAKLSQVVPFLVPNCCQTSGCQIFLFLLARNCRMLYLNPANPPKLSKRANVALGAAKLEAVASQVVPFLVQN